MKTEPYIFNGPEYVPARDNKPLLSQLDRVRDCMEGGAWRTLDEIASITGDPVSSVSAQLRHLRKKRFGSNIIERRIRVGRLYEYRKVTCG